MTPRIGGDVFITSTAAVIAIGEVVLDGPHTGRRAAIGAGALAAPGREVRAGHLWLGSPGAVRRPLNAEESAFLAYAPGHYRLRPRQYLVNSIGGRRR